MHIQILCQSVLHLTLKSVVVVSAFVLAVILAASSTVHFFMVRHLFLPSDTICILASLKSNKCCHRSISQQRFKEKISIPASFWFEFDIVMKPCNLCFLILYFHLKYNFAVFCYSGSLPKSFRESMWKF